MGNKHSSQKVGEWFANNHTLQLLSDPVKPIEQLLSTAHDDVADVVSYGGQVGQHLVGDVDTVAGGLSTGLSTISLPLVIGGVVVVLLLARK